MVGVALHLAAELIESDPDDDFTPVVAVGVVGLGLVVACSTLAIRAWRKLHQRLSKLYSTVPSAEPSRAPWRAAVRETAVVEMGSEL